MSLKITHSVVIIMSILLTAYFSFVMSNSTIEYSSTFSLLSAFLSMTLVYYLYSIIKKFQVIWSMKKIISFSVFALFFIADSIMACSTCYGNPNSDAAKGMDMAIITLLGIIGPLLFAILMGIISIGMRSKKMNQVK